MARSRRVSIQLPPPRAESPEERFYHDRGERAPWERVMRDGVEVTDSVPPEQWHWPYSMYWEAGWRPWRSLNDPGTRYLPRD